MRLYFTILISILLEFTYAQSIIVNPVGNPNSSLNAEELTREVLIDGGACSSIDNFQLKENPSAQYPSTNRSWGYFEKNNSAFPFEKGIVLTSGYARKAQIPHGGIDSDGTNNWTGDSDATTLAGDSTYNATIFEFDFIPYGDEISFNYIFASHEYPNYSCFEWNDVFGFIISGPGITPDPGLSGRNIARLPNGQPVTINNVNDQYCGDSTFYVGGTFGYMNYGGRTTVLTAQSPVIPGETYHIKLLVADTADTLYDSAVFLEAGSFDLGGTLIDMTGIEIEDGKVVCGASSYALIANVQAPGATFQWYFNGEIIPGATGQQYTATETGTYKVEIQSASCQVEAEVYIVFSENPEALATDDSKCSSDGTSTFNLTDYENEISTSADINFRYYNTQAGANNEDIADLITNFQDFDVTGTTTVYVRVENENACYKVIPLTLEVKVGPDTTPAEYSICDDNGDGFEEFDLTSQYSELVNIDPATLNFEFYLDAATTELITNPENFINTSSPQIIYVKIIDDTINEEEACESIETLTLLVDEFPELQPDSITICDNLNDSSELIDLTQNNIVVTEGIDVSYEYYDTNNNIIVDPTNYEVTSSPTVITVRVKNANESCEDEMELTILFDSAPEVENTTLEECSTDGFATFHLPDANGDIIGDANGIDFLYYLSYNDALNGDPANALPNDFTNTENNQIIYVRVENEDGCYNISEIELYIGLGPEHMPYQAEICDDNGDGFMEFNLVNLAGNLLVGPPDNIEFGYFLDQAGTQPINNPEAYTNITNPQVVYVSLVDTEGDQDCLVIGELTLFVNEFPEIQEDFIQVCDNLHDGVEIIDLTQNNIVATQGINVNLHYFLEIGGDEITDPQNFEVSSSPTVVYVLVKNQAGTCEDYQTLTIEMQESPQASEDEALLENCSLDDYANFHLPDANASLVNDVSGLNFSYHLTYDQAFNGESPLPNNYQNTSQGQIVFVRIENANGCFDIGRIQLDVVLVHEELPNIFSVCDDPYEINDGVAHFDLTTRHSDIENILGGNNYQVSYYTSLEDAVSGNNPIQNPTNYQNTSNPQVIYAQAASGQGGCAGVVDFMIEVLEVPEFDLDKEIYFCTEDINKSFQFFDDFESYTWFDSSGSVIATGSIVEFIQEGTYTLEVTSTDSQCVARRDIEVIFDSAPVIIDIEVDGNTVIVHATGGYAPYKYSFNNGLTWSNSNRMYDVPSGVHEMIVQSRYGCYSAEKTFGVLGIPNFISPNGDGRNDYWEVRGLEAYPNTNVKIFDRYGKIFVDRMMSADFRWDGTYMGRTVASGDYWYIITLEDGRAITGHISVRHQ